MMEHNVYKVLEEILTIVRRLGEPKMVMLPAEKDPNALADFKDCLLAAGVLWSPEAKPDGDPVEAHRPQPVLLGQRIHMCLGPLEGRTAGEARLYCDGFVDGVRAHLSLVKVCLDSVDVPYKVVETL